MMSSQIFVLLCCITLSGMILNLMMSTDRESDSVTQIQLVFKNADIVHGLYPFNATLALHLYR